ncbi:MAG TPA: hypothetical protein PLL69_01760 [Gemmatimonadales bacterium]|nr:hypothetical protein [Gemmatimonadales bacterium]
MTSDTIPIFVNGSLVPAVPGSTLAEVLSGSDPDLLEGLVAGAAVATDARGIAVDPDTPVHAGAIYRVFRSARNPDATDA